MTMSSAVSKVTLNGDGVQTTFPFPFKVWKAGDLEVILTSPEGTESVTTDWSVVLAGIGGTLTYPVLGDTLPTGWKITIRRSMDFLQEVDLVSGTRWDPEVVETALDQAAAERQQLLEEIRRAVRVGVASTEDPAQVVNQVFLARDQAAALAGAAATSESNAADSAAAAQLAASHIGVLGAEGTLTTGQDTITLPFAYDFEKEAIAVYLGGIRQNKASLTFPDAYTVVLGTPVAVNTEYIVSSVTLEGEAILTGLRDDAVAAKDEAEDARDEAEALVGTLTNFPIGGLIWFTAASAPAGYIVADGELRSRAAFPDLWAFAQASGNISVDDASWTFGQYSPGDGSTTFRVPKVDDRFIRGKSATRAVGLVEEDAIRNITGEFRRSPGTGVVDGSSISGAFEAGTTNRGALTSTTVIAGYDVIFDASNVVPTADENRPKALTMLPCIKAYDVISDPNVLNAVAVVNSISENYNELNDKKLNKDENINLGVSVAASGTAVDFVGIPEGVKRITVMFNGVSTNGTSLIQAQLGSALLTTIGYKGSASYIGGTTLHALYVSGFIVSAYKDAAHTYFGKLVIENIKDNIWVASVSTARGDAAATSRGDGSISLEDTLDRIRITTVNGTNQFDAGTINISWEF